MTRPPDAQLTHLGLAVRDIDAMVDFYCGLLGLEVTDTGLFNGRRIAFMSRNAREHHQLVLVAGREGDAPSPVTQISFRVAALEDLQHYWREAVTRGLRNLSPSDHGNAWSIYFLDPEGNRLEIYAPSPWYVTQPHWQPVDLGAAPDQIRATTLAAISQSPSFQPQSAWSESLARRLAGDPAPDRSPQA